MKIRKFNVPPQHLRDAWCSLRRSPSRAAGSNFIINSTNSITQKLGFDAYALLDTSYNIDYGFSSKSVRNSWNVERNRSQRGWWVLISKNWEECCNSMCFELRQCIVIFFVWLYFAMTLGVISTVLFLFYIILYIISTSVCHSESE